jgi:hypothetical protein
MAREHSWLTDRGGIDGYGASIGSCVWLLTVVWLIGSHGGIGEGVPSMQLERLKMGG